MITESLEDQVRALRERKDGAVEALVQEYTSPLMGAAFALGFSAADAEELVQDTFVALLAALERFEMRSKLKTYIFGILYNKAWTLRGKQNREEAFDPQEPDFAKRFDTRGMWVTPPKGPEDAALTPIPQSPKGLFVNFRGPLFSTRSRFQLCLDDLERDCPHFGHNAAKLAIVADVAGQ